MLRAVAFAGISHVPLRTTALHIKGDRRSEDCTTRPSPYIVSQKGLRKVSASEYQTTYLLVIYCLNSHGNGKLVSFQLKGPHREHRGAK